MNEHILEQFGIHYTSEELLKTQTFEPNQIIATPETGYQGFLSLSGGQLTGDLLFKQPIYKIYNDGANYSGTAQKALADINNNFIPDTYAKIANLNKAVEDLNNLTENFNNHNHDDIYSKLGHTHTESDIIDLKDYSLTSHNHDDIYSKLDHTHEEYKEYTDTAIANLINSAPGDLDTLKELADMVTDNKSILEALENSYVTLSTEQQITGYKKFDDAKFRISDGDYRYPLTSPSATSTAKRYLVGVENANAKYSNYHTSIYMQSGYLYSNGLRVSTTDHTHNYATLYTGTSATQSSNTTVTSVLRIGYISNNLYIWNS